MRTRARGAGPPAKGTTLLSRTTRGCRALLAIALVGVALAGCGDDSDDGTNAGGDGDGGTNAITVEMKDYSYVVKGELQEGFATITTTNTGDEFHMMELFKLKDGVTLDEVKDELAKQTGQGGTEGGESEDDAPTTTEGALESPDFELIAQTSSTSTTEGEMTTQQTGGAEEEEGGAPEDEDPFAKFFDDEVEIDAFSQILQPGREQSVTANALDEGTYAIICFIPSADDEGLPHFANGMISEIEVSGEQSDAEAPTADATYALSDEEAPEGPAELKAGEVTLEFTSDTNNNEAIGALPDDGESFASMDEWFTEIFETGEAPDADYAEDIPGTLAFNSFVIPRGKSVWITVDLDEGEYEFVNRTKDDEGGQDDNDLKVTVA